MNAIENYFKQFDDITKLPAPYLNGDVDISNQFIKITANIYKLAKLLGKTVDNDPFPQLLFTGFDEEQIWQQVELFNSEALMQLRKQVFQFEKEDDLSLLKDEVEENGSLLVDDLSDDDKQESTENEEENSESVDEGENMSHSAEEEFYEKTIVDDDFFSLRQMEKFLDTQETVPSGGGEGNNIDYFDDIPSTDDEGELSAGEMSDDENNKLDESEEDHVSARQLKYQDFFHDAIEPVEMEESKTVETKPSRNVGKQNDRLVQKIEKLEEKALAEPDWQMKGETSGSKRPVNSLLEEVLQFDQTERTAPEITDEHTHDLETIICQRIKERLFDDVQRKIKEVKNPHEFKQKIVLNSEQSKLSLHEIYEKEYLNKISVQPQEEKENPSHAELKSLMKDLFRKLDALSNFHFRAAQPEPEIKVIKNLPSIAMEEVQPIAHADSNMLAPEEVLGHNDTKADAEKTTTDKKRERRKKKTKQKARAKARSDKLQALAQTNEKLKSLQAIHKLEQQAKLPGSQTTIVKAASKKRENLTSSKAFFNRLEETKLQTPVNRKNNVKSN
uniref:U3 small nucleolar ribonucleoprotein protein MPP10 n=1 Tax=Phallusia mammillata TaxID=59560 RepID=A0A6F9DL65_9ASCI|nr:U3 small nucleolar ribonucleoprotein protein MPP10-like [Phallusia mammillata]